MSGVNALELFFSAYNRTDRWEALRRGEGLPEQPFLTGTTSAVDAPRGAAPQRAYGDKACDLFIAANEVCAAHGTGILIMRLMEQSNAPVLIRTDTLYGGRCDVEPVEEFVFNLARRSRKETVDQVGDWLRPYAPRMIVCVPYYENELHIALAAKALTGAPLAIYLMDDNVLYANGIDRAVMAEALKAADVRFVISPEMRNEYQNQFREKFWVLPPLVAGKFLRKAPSKPPENLGAKRSAVIVGNVWDQDWLGLLRKTLKDSSWEATWYTGGDTPAWLNFDVEEMAADGLRWVKETPQHLINDAVEKAPFIIVPYGTMAETGHQLALSKMSMPSRIPFIIATAGAPILVLGHPDTGAAKLVRRFDIGETCPYDGKAFDAAAERLLDPKRQAEIRARAHEIAPTFRSEGSLELIRSAVRTGAPADRRFETLFPVQPGEFAPYVEYPTPSEVWADFKETYLSLRRLADGGYEPDFVLDIGSSTGIWSWTMAPLFPDARFILCDPMFSRYPNQSQRPGFKVIEAAVSDKDGTMEFLVSDDLYNSSLVAVGYVASKTETLKAEVITVDTLVAREKVRGRGILKIDVQFAEHLVLAGAAKTLKEQIDFVVLELTMLRPHPSAKTFFEMVQLMETLGFRYFDDIGDWRGPADGMLEQKDVLFVREDLESFRTRPDITAGV